MLPLNEQLNIVVALPCEARVFIEGFKLKQRCKVPFAIYANEHETIVLIVSGMGLLNAAAATSYIQALTGDQAHACYLNFGIAGGAQAQVGDLMAINKLFCEPAAKVYYPVNYSGLNVNSKFNIQSTPLCSFWSAQDSYPDEGLVDMEAYAVLQTAIKFVSLEQVFFIKLISDNDEATLAQLNAQRVLQLVAPHRETLLEITAGMLALSEELMQQTVAVDLEPFLKTWHFTQYQQNELMLWLKRWAVHLEELDPVKACRNCNSAAGVLVQLSKTLDEASYRW